MSVYIYTDIYVYIYIYACMCIYVYICIYIFGHIYIHILHMDLPTCIKRVVPTATSRKLRYPKISPAWEIQGVPGLYAAGTLTHSLDFRKSAGGFIHGFRHSLSLSIPRGSTLHESALSKYNICL